MKKFLLSVAVAHLFIPALTAHAEVAEIQWAGAAAVAREFRVEPGKFAEWCGKLRAGEKISWRFEAASALNFNIHFHQGKDVQFPAKQDAASSAEGVLQVGIDQDYCWMWTNKAGVATTVRAEVKKMN